jgi:hypothetical protein
LHNDNEKANEDKTSEHLSELPQVHVGFVLAVEKRDRVAERRGLLRNDCVARADEKPAIEGEQADGVHHDCQPRPRRYRANVKEAAAVYRYIRCKHALGDRHNGTVAVRRKIVARERLELR